MEPAQKHSASSHLASCTIRRLALFLAIVALPGCQSGPTVSTGTPPTPAFDANWTERPIIQIPASLVVVSKAHSDNSRITELVLPGQTAEHWTDMITLVSARKDGQTVDSVLQHMAEAAALGCETPPVLGAPNRFIDAGYPAAVQYAVCHKTTRWGLPELFIYKTIEGDSGYYQILRSWRFPDGPRSSKPVFLKAALEEGLRLLDSAHICNTSRADRPCPPFE